MVAMVACKFNKFGFCRYQDKCQNLHFNKVCVVKDCEIENCEKRHPRIFRFYREYGRCKFGGYCKYSHDRSRDLSCEKEFRELKQKIQALENMIACLDFDKNELVAKITLLENKLGTASMGSEQHSSNSSDIIVPQVDGMVEEVTDPFKCENCNAIFLTQSDVTTHEEEMPWICEKCRICFPSEFEHDVHEHSLHTEEYFEVNSLTPRRKQEAYERLRKLYP